MARKINGIEADQDADSSGQETSVRKGGSWVWRAYDAFALLLVIYLVVSQMVGNAIWPITVLAYVALLVLPIAFIMLPLAIYRRRWFGVIMQSICALAFVLVMSDTRAENLTAEAPPGSLEVTVLTFNIGDGMASPEDLIPMLRATDSDIVALVEVTSDVADAIGAELKDVYPYQEVRGGGIPGKGLLSKYPISEAEWLDFNPGRPDLRVVLQLDSHPVTVIVAHPPPPELTWTGIRERPGTQAQVDALLGLVESTDGPLLLLGDFNITRQHDLYDEISATGLQDTFHISGSGFGFTMPARLQHLKKIGGWFADIRIMPLVRIDYIWASSEWLPLKAWVGADAGSDHLPVVARLALLPA